VYVLVKHSRSMYENGQQSVEFCLIVNILPWTCEHLTVPSEVACPPQEDNWSIPVGSLPLEKGCSPSPEMPV
jgi:hypothetical protein